MQFFKIDLLPLHASRQTWLVNEISKIVVVSLRNIMNAPNTSYSSRFESIKVLWFIDLELYLPRPKYRLQKHYYSLKTLFQD